MPVLPNTPLLQQEAPVTQQQPRGVSDARKASKKSGESFLFCNNNNNAAQQQECAICFDYLPERPVAVLLNTGGERSCRHYFHHDCVRSLLDASMRSCPLCRADFWRAEQLPDIRQQPREWFKL